MKVAILMLDGLNYCLAKRFKTLRQEEIGRVINNVTKIDRNLTTVIWSSFMTGKMPEVHGCTPDVHCRDARIKPGVKTILDYAKKPIALWIPAICPHPSYWKKEITTLCVKGASGDREAREKFRSIILKTFQEQRETFLRKLDEEWDLIVAHFNIIDALGHVYRDLTKMLPYVVLVSKFVEEVKAKIDNKTWLLCVSDHGIEIRGKHMQDAFYSSNIKLGLVNPKVTDFFPLIVKKLKENV